MATDWNASKAKSAVGANRVQATPRANPLFTRLAVTLAAALLAGASALLPWQMSGETAIFVGAVFYLVPALWFGPALGLLAALPAAITVWLNTGHLTLAILPLLEAGCIGMLYRAGVRPLFSGLVFWIGALAILLIGASQGLNLPGGWASSALLPVFGLTAVMIAEALMHGAKTLLPIDPNNPPGEAPIGDTLRYWLTFVSLLPLLLIALIGGGNQLAIAERDARLGLAHKAEALRLVLDNHIKTHLDLLRLQAGQLPPPQTSDPAVLSNQLRGLRQNYPAFLSLIVADDQGRVLAAAFSEKLSDDLAVLEKGYTVNDRAYFTEPKRSALPYVSNVFRGRGFGNDIVSAISIPLRNTDGSFAGILEGSLNLSRFDQLDELTELDERHEFIIIDGDDKVLFADSNSRLSPLQQYFAQDDSAPGAERKLTTSERLASAPWTAITKQPYSSAIAPAGRYFITLAWLLPLAGLFATLIARQLARRFSAPLENIVAQLRERMSLVHSHQFDQLQQPPLAYAEVAETVNGVNALLRTLGRSYDDLEQTIAERDQLNRSLNETLNHMDSLVRQRTADLADALRAAKSANDAKNVFLAKTSHEIRTPMHAIIGINELLRTLNLSKEQAHYTHLIGDAAESLLALIDEILDFSKIEAGQLEIRPEALRLGQLLENVTELMSDRAQQKGLELKLTTRDLPEWVLLDPIRVRQVLLNLINNAIKFTQRGTIEIEATRSGKPSAPRLQFRVADSGIGIPAEKLGDVFEPFMQLGNPDSSEHSGSGLGLSICKRAIELSGGKIGVESEPGKGSTFWFELPLEEPAEAPVEARLESESELVNTGQPLLVVDDNDVNRQMLVHQLNYLGFDADQVGSGAEALDYQREHHPALIWLDCQMPKLDGFEVSRRIRQTDTKQPYIIAITAQTTDQAQHRCLQAGMDDFVSKPAKLHDIRNALHRWQQGAPAEPTTPAPSDGVAPVLPVLDESVLSSWREIEQARGQPIVSDMLDSLLEQLGAASSGLRQLAATDGYVELKAESHRLKGSSGTIGATRIAATLADLEQACQDQDQAECQTLLTTLASEIRLLRAAAAELNSARPSVRAS